MNILSEFVDIWLHALKEVVGMLNETAGHILLATCLGLIGVWLAYGGHDMAAGHLLTFLGIAAYAMRGPEGSGAAKSKPPIPTDEAKPQ